MLAIDSLAGSVDKVFEKLDESNSKEEVNPYTSNCKDVEDEQREMTGRGLCLSKSQVQDLPLKKTNKQTKPSDSI